MRNFARAALLCVVAILLRAELVRAQTPAAGVAPQGQAGDALTPEEQAQFDAAGQKFGAEKYAEALAMYKPLVAAHPGNAQVMKFAAEAAINAGEKEYALGLLQPMEAANPDDWQATALLVRVYAETGDQQHRDAEMAHMVDLYKKGVVPARLQQYIVEKVQEKDKSILIWRSLTPWGNYHVYDYARVFDRQGQMLFRITVESNDFDHPEFAKEHPAEAAVGKRAFSLDGYKEGPANEMQRTETHMTFGFLVGEPSYDEVREDFVKIATGTWKPMSDSTHAVQ
jgi:Tetratricopeptide repeat